MALLSIHKAVSRIFSENDSKASCSFGIEFSIDSNLWLNITIGVIFSQSNRIIEINW
jgi:hypothetical protein